MYRAPSGSRQYPVGSMTPSPHAGRCQEGREMSDTVVMQVKLVGPPEDADKMLHEIVVPTAKAQPGFQSGIWLHDGAGNGMGVITFASAEEAEAAKGVL